MDPYTIAQFYSNRPTTPARLPKAKVFARISPEMVDLAWNEYADLSQFSSLDKLAKQLGCGTSLLRSRFLIRYGYQYKDVVRLRTNRGDID